MRYVISIDLDGDAFASYPYEVANMLGELAHKCETDTTKKNGGQFVYVGPLLDGNGNTCGKAEVIESNEEE